MQALSSVYLGTLNTLVNWSWTVQWIPCPYSPKMRAASNHRWFLLNLIAFPCDFHVVGMDKWMRAIILIIFALCCGSFHNYYWNKVKYHFHYVMNVDIGYTFLNEIARLVYLAFTSYTNNTKYGKLFFSNELII